MVDSISSVSFTHNTKITEKKSARAAKSIFLCGLSATGLYSLASGTRFVYPKLNKALRFGIPAVGLGLIGYGVYKSIANKNETKKEFEPVTKKDYLKSALAGGAVAAAFLPIDQAVSTSLISLKFSNGVKDFFKILKNFFPQVKNYMHGMYAGLLSKVGIKNLSANKAILLGTLAVAGIGALGAMAIQGINDLIARRSNKK